MDTSTMHLQAFEKEGLIPKNYEEVPRRFAKEVSEALKGRLEVVVDSSSPKLSRWAKRREARKVREREMVSRCNDYYRKLST